MKLHEIEWTNKKILRKQTRKERLNKNALRTQYCKYPYIKTGYQNKKCRMFLWHTQKSNKLIQRHSNTQILFYRLFKLSSKMLNLFLAREETVFSKPSAEKNTSRLGSFGRAACVLKLYKHVAFLGLSIIFVFGPLFIIHFFHRLFIFSFGDNLRAQHPPCIDTNFQRIVLYEISFRFCISTEIWSKLCWLIKREKADFTIWIKVKEFIVCLSESKTL